MEGVSKVRVIVMELKCSFKLHVTIKEWIETGPIWRWVGGGNGS